MSWLFLELLVFSGSAAGIVMHDFDLNGTNTWECLETRRENENFFQVGQTFFDCAKKNLYTGLLRNLKSECVDIGDGVTFLRQSSDEVSPRSIFTSVDEPATVRGLIDAYSNFLSQRSVRWDLSYFYPGLVLRIGPTLNGAGILEFVLDKRLDYHERAKLGPGQLIVRRTILPHLLGFRMNLSSLLPLVFGIVILITKNAFVFSKVTLVLSVLMTLKSLVLLQLFRPNQHEQNYQHHPHNPVMNDPVDFMVAQ